MNIDERVQMGLSLTFVLSQLFNGLAWGVILGLLAIGLSIIFGMLNVLNFAHGSLYLIGAYVGYSFILALTKLLGTSIGSFWIALVLAPIIVGVLGLIIEFFLLRHVYQLGHIYHILLTFGLYLIIQELVIIIWSSSSMSFPTPNIFKGVVDLGFMIYPKYRLFVLIVSPLIMVAIWLLLEKTKYGSIIRAGAEDVEMTSLMGINIKRLFTLIFAFGAALAGLAGVFAGPVFGALHPDLGNPVLLASFVVVVLGGLRSFTGAVVGAILVGLTKALTIIVYPAGADVVIFLIMAVILVVRPQGLLGKG